MADDDRVGSAFGGGKHTCMRPRNPFQMRDVRVGLADYHLVSMAFGPCPRTIIRLDNLTMNRLRDLKSTIVREPGKGSGLFPSDKVLDEGTGIEQVAIDPARCHCYLPLSAAST
jgi:hypothetical protein